METVLITGASRGIGLELCQQFLNRGFNVLATYRGSSSTDLQALAEAERLSLYELEVLDQGSIDSLSAALHNQPIDILINNAGVLGPDKQELDGLDVKGWLDTFAVNSIAPLTISMALLENLKQASNGRIITITSQMGSLNRQSTGKYAYRSSKAAANKVMQVLSLELREFGITVCPVHPGWVKTDMGGEGADITAQASASGICELAAQLTLEQSGQFLTWQGTIHAW